MWIARILGIVTLLLNSLAAAPGAAAPEEESKGPLYVSLPPISTPLISGSRLGGRVFLRVDLAIENPVARAKIEKLQPRLEAAYLERLGLLAQYGLAPDKAIDLPLLAALLQRATDRVLEPGTARVLVQEAVVRR